MLESAYILKSTMNEKFYQKNHIYIINFLLSIPFVSFFLSYYYGTSYSRAASLVFGFACLFGLRIQNKVVMKYVLITIIAPLLIFALINVQHSEGVSVVVVSVLLAQLAISFYLIENIKIAFVVDYFFYFFLAFTIFSVVVLGYGPEEFDVFFSGVGRNGYSAILFALSVGYCVRRVLSSREISILLIALTTAVMVPLYGRSSLMASAILMVAVLVRRFRFQSLYFGLALLLPASLELDLTNVFDSITTMTNLKSGLESERWDVINEWLAKMSYGDFFIGYDLNKLETVKMLDGNPHNFFLRLHSFFGVSVFVLIFILMYSVFCLFKDRRFFLLCVFASIFIKIFFDIIFFIGDQDFLLYPVLFYPIFRSSLRSAGVLQSHLSR